MSVSQASVRTIWMRHNLITVDKRIAAVETRIASEGLTVSIFQKEAIERRKARKYFLDNRKETKSRQKLRDIYKN
jgi:hypothetical protein